MRRWNWMVPLATIVPLLAVMPAKAATGPTPNTVAHGSALSLPSIVFIIDDEAGTLVDSNGNTHGPYAMSYIGTGFFISSDGYIVTAAHVAARTADEIKGDLIDTYIDEKYNCDPSTATDECAAIDSLHHDNFMRQMMATEVSANVHVLTQNQSGNDPGLLAKVVASSTSSSHDTAVIKIDGQNEPVSLLGQDSTIKIGDPVAVMGYPASAESTDQGFSVIPTVTSGQVQAKLRGNPFDPAATDAHLFEVSAQIEPGNSGGPGVAGDGTVDGIVSFGDTGGNSNYLVTADDIKGIVAKTPAQNQLGPIDTLYRNALAAEAANDGAQAAKLFAQCAAMNPVQIYCATPSGSANRPSNINLTALTNFGPLLENALQPPNNAGLYAAGAAGAFGFLLAAWLIWNRGPHRRVARQVWQPPHWPH